MNKKQQFEKKASELLKLDKWGNFLNQWANALESYGTPRDFVYSTTYQEGEVTFFGQNCPAMYVSSANNAQRRELMAKQEKYHPLQKKEEYGLRLSLENCFLCENTVQAIDAENDSNIPNNLMYDEGIHFIFPNRYPSQFGHSLSMPKNHDNTLARVTPNGKTYLPEENKTRGALLTDDYLLAVMETCDKYGLVAMRNHVLDGMSIPGHDHFHLFPEDLPPFQIIDNVVGEKEKTEYAGNIVRPQHSPFDTLIVESTDISETAIPLLQGMELDNQVFTLFYRQGDLFVSPRQQVNDRIQVGAGVPIHYLDTKGQEFIDRLEKYTPQKGCFDWDKYF